ncbi:MAG: FAA hydrolase family protein [Chromatiaceae bacterium]|nr:MAG: FAA hydrolase family protein [Chromatiaceae bacterium]
MHIIRFADPAGRVHYGRPSVRHPNDRHPGAALAGDYRRAEVLAGDPFTGLAATGTETEVARLLAPILPCNIFCIGLNYRAHAAETGAAIPPRPIVFMKPTTALNHPGQPIPLPLACDQGPEVDYEAELAVVIGRQARDVPAARALEHVLGYTCANDVSARRWQREGGGGQWVRGKGFDGFCPLGPVLVTADEIADPQALHLRCLLNDETVQQGHSGDMIFSVAELIAFLSRDTTLAPGTLILTGTPPGVGMARTPPRFLAAGDRVRVEIDGIGALENPVVAATGAGA